jgi:acyl CoA:acetate/3-ketoacid CoA transferase
MSINIHKAVLSLYTNAVHISGNDVDSLIVLDENNNQITISSEQVTAQVIVLETQYAEQQQAQATAKASAIAKLTALGLSAEEISAIGA